MSEDILKRIRDERPERVANQWYINKVKELAGTNYPGPKFQQDYTQNLTNKLLPGRFYLFKYDPIGKETLSYYDMFPLVMPFSMDGNGFTGINFHYLAPVQRLVLMDKLSSYKRGSGDIGTRIYADWDILKNFAKFREVKPSVKRYRKSQVKSRFLFIEPEDWPTAVVLPTEKFIGRAKQSVYVESNRQMRSR